MKVPISYEVFINGELVEGCEPQEAQIENIASLDDLVKGIQKRWGINCDIKIQVWRANYSA